MGIDSSTSWQPDWAVVPGEILQESLDEQGMTQAELARRMDRPAKTINEIVKGKAAITPETALQLERTLGISAAFWNALESDYRQFLARKQAAEELEGQSAWLDAFPVHDMIKRGLLPKGVSTSELMERLLAFFRVGSPKAWEKHWLSTQASFRASAAFESSVESVATWLRWGEILADEVDVTATWDVEKLQSVVVQLPELTRVDPVADAIDEVKDLLLEAGVVLILTPELQGTRLSGATRWLSPDKALVQLSLRHKTDDQVWFTLVHEVGHLLEPGRKCDHVDVADDESRPDSESERFADEFARNLLVPPGLYEDFVSAGDFSATSVRSFARELGIAAGLVVGRLQRDDHIGKGQLNGLKRSVGWVDII